MSHAMLPCAATAALQTDRLALAGWIAQALLPGDTVLALGLPRRPVIRLLAGARPDLDLVEALSDPVLAAWPQFATSLAQSCLARHMVGLRAGFGALAETRAFAGQRLPGPAVSLQVQALPTLLAVLRAPGLLYLGPEPGHGPLLAAALPQLAAGRCVVWWDLPPERAEPERLLAAMPDPVAFQCYAWVPGRGLCTVDAGIGAALRSGARLLLLVPRSGWDCPGLAHLAGAAAGPLPPALLPRGHGGTAALLARLAPARPRPMPQALLPEAHMALPGIDLFASGARPLQEGGALLWQTRWQACAGLAAMAWAPGHYRLRLHLARPPSAALAARLTVRVAGLLPLPLLPVAAEASPRLFDSVGALPVPDPEQPLCLNLQAGGAPVDLLVAGLELRIESWAAGAAAGGAPLAGPRAEGETDHV